MKEDLTGCEFGPIVVTSRFDDRSWMTTCKNCGVSRRRYASNIKRYRGCKNCSGKSKSESGLRRLYVSYVKLAEKNERVFQLSIDQFEKLTSSHCHYCGRKPEQISGSNLGREWKKSTWGDYLFNGIDRKNNGIGYIWENCLPCCWTCNHNKGTKGYDEFICWLNAIASFRKPVGKIQVLVGPIASGKTTYSQNAAKQGIISINDDAVVNMLHANEYTLYDKNLKILYKTIENQTISMGLAMGRCVLVDRGLNVSVQGRQRWLALAKSYDVPCEAIVLKNEGPEIHAQRRVLSDARGHDFKYWLRVANAHQDVYSIPSTEEGFAAVHRISYDEIKEGKVIA